MMPIETIKRRIASSFGHLKQPAVLDDTVYRLRIGLLQLLQNPSAPFLPFIIPNGIRSPFMSTTMIQTPLLLGALCLSALGLSACEVKNPISPPQAPPAAQATLLSAQQPEKTKHAGSNTANE